MPVDRTARRRLRTATRVLAEMGIIVFSVVLALAANEWRQAQSRDATVAAVRTTIRSEVAQNRAQVQRALAHHAELRDQLLGGGVVLARLHLGEARIDTTSAPALARTLAAAARERGAEAGIQLTAARVRPGEWSVQQGGQQLRFMVDGDSATLRGVGNIALQPPFLIDSAWETAQVTQAAVHMDPDVIASMARARQLTRMLDQTISRAIDMLYARNGGGDILAALQDMVMMQCNLTAAYDDLLERLGHDDGAAPGDGATAAVHDNPYTVICGPRP